MIELLRREARTHGVERRAPTPHQLVQATFTFVLAGGRGTRLKQLTDQRAKPALPFAGQLKIVDFALGNCLNSGLRRIAVLTQYKAQSLIRHVTRGYGDGDAALGEFVDVVPAQQKTGAAWYAGTADAVFQNLDLLREADARYVLVLAGDHIYKMDYSRLLADHVRRRAQVTVACIDVPIDDARSFGVLRVDDEGRVIDFAEKPADPAPLPGQPDRALASMGIYAFDANFLAAELERDAADRASGRDFGHDLLPQWVKRSRVFAHGFADSCVNMVAGVPYWRDVGTLDAYWEANMDLTRPLPELNLYDEHWPIRSLHHHRPPAKFVFDDEGRRGLAIDSLVASGCIVSGATVRRSVLFTGARVDDGALVEDSIVLPGARVGRSAVLKRAIVDEGVVLPDGIRIGLHPAEDRAHFTVSERGVVLVTAAMLAPA